MGFSSTRFIILKKGKSFMKKVIALILAAVIVVSMTACASQGKETETAQATAATMQATATSEAATQAGTDAKETEAVETSRLPLVEPGSVTLTIGIKTNANTIDYETNEYTKWLEEQTGINLDFVTFSSTSSEAATQFSLMVNSGEKLPDIMWGYFGITPAAINEYGEDGYIVDLSEYFKNDAYYYNQRLESLDEATVNNIWAFGKDPTNGAIYTFPSYTYSPDVDIIANKALINTKWLEAVGSEMPQTVNELEEVLTKFLAEDPNGNGKTDEMGLVGSLADVAGSDICEWVLNAYIFNNDAYWFNIDENGSVYLPYTKNEYREGLKKLNDWYKKGLISDLYFTVQDKNEMMALATPADGVSIAGVYAGHPQLIVENEAENLFEYEALPALKDETGLGGYQAINSATFQYRNFITTDCEDPELAFKLLDFMACEESTINQRYGPGNWEYAQEGDVNADGVQLTAIAKDGTLWSTQNNVHWHVLSGIIFDYSKTKVMTQDAFDALKNGETSETWSDRSTSWRHDQEKVWFAGAQPKNVFYQVVYNSNETEELSEIITNVQSYIKEAKALFINGSMDPNKDEDWQKYLDSLKALGIDTYVERTQNAYSR